MRKILPALLLLIFTNAHAQVKMGNNPNSINSNSLLEMESTNKGFLPPRVALTSTSSVSPLAGTVPAGMLVFSSGGTLIDGYYYWDGTGWVMFAPGQANLVTKTASATLTRLGTFVLASNDITLTLPVVTAADNGLSITIKNVGSYTDLVIIQGNGGALLDNTNLIALPRWFSLTMTANGGNWVFKERTTVAASTLEVSTYSPWQTIQEAIEFLNLHMWGPTVIKLASGSFDIDQTLVIDLPFSLTIEGASYGTSIITAATGLANKPMFRCLSDCYFKKLEFDATTLSGYGTNTGEDGIRLLGSGTYNEVKDCSFDGFYNAILDSTNAELWLFETDIYNAHANGLLIRSADDSTVVKVAETDFISCKRGVMFEAGHRATIQLASGGYYNQNSTDTAIVYRPSTFTSPVSMSIKGNLWNNTGKYIEGFDFSRSDGRDANIILESNAGTGDSKPQCFINVLNSTTGTSMAVLNTWYKVDWGTNTTTQATKWTINNNRITYQPSNRRNGWIIISGNISTEANSQNVTVGIVKNGVTGTQYGATTIRTVTADQPFPFSIIVYLSDIAANDYFELYCKNETSSLKTVKFQDIQWLVNTQ